VTDGQCRSCGAPLSVLFADLGPSPISNDFPTPEQAAKGERVYPLRAFVCDRCWLVQLQDVVEREVHFNAEYPYFSSFSSTWLDHARRFADFAVERFKLDRQSRVVEIASNDGYLLQHFVKRGIPSIGIDPAANCAEAARKCGVETLVAFFGSTFAEQLRASHGPADLIVANNVLAHVPDLSDFVVGVSALLKPHGVATFEFPHLLELIARNEFDTIYHEHYSYLSLLAVEPLFARHGLKVIDAERLPTHGHSLRLYVMPSAAASGRSAALEQLAQDERAAGLDQLAVHSKFSDRAKATKRLLLKLLISLKKEGKTIVGYGAPAKGTTLLNYCGIGTDFLDFTVDRNPAKQGRLVPGTGIPIRAPEAIRAAKPDYVLILPWNIAEEIMADLAEIKTWGGRFIVPIPEPKIVV
jgi:2-polyprenyl-3-methyl-5-hydroxy-6-metoxy-1,4-benzoquinol methylase